MTARAVLPIAFMLLVLACGSAEVSVTSAPGRWTEPSTQMAFVKVPAAGGLAPFWIGAYEVTQAQWEGVRDQDNPSWFHDGSGRLPMENVNWFEVTRFVDRLNARGEGVRFRLPTEAEWEHACRAGTRAEYSTGTTLTPQAANIASSPEGAAGGRTVAVGSYAPNAWGLYDMHGNVWEWTQDDIAGGTPLKIIRGGSWYFGADSAACGLRYTHRPQDRGFSIGFRLAADR